MDISIIIVNYKTPSLVVRCLESIYATTSRSFEIIVVDNGSEDDSCSIIAQRFPDVRYVANPTNEGFGRANNRGLKEAIGKVILFLNSDIVVSAGAIDRCFCELQANKNYGAISCRLVNEDGSDQRSVYYDIVSWGSLFNQNILLVKIFGRRKDQKMIRALMGSFLMIPASVIDQVGPFDPDFFMYFEEIDLCRRITGQGLGLKCIEDVFAWHKHGASSKDSRWRNQQLFLSQALLVYKAKGWFGYCFYHFFFMVNMLSNTLVSVFLGETTRRNIISTNSAYLASTFQYFLIPFRFSRKPGKGRRLLKR